MQLVDSGPRVAQRGHPWNALLTVCKRARAQCRVFGRWGFVVRYEVLGPVEVHVDDEALAIGGPQQRRVLALLLQRPGQSVSTNRMVDCLWTDGAAPDGAARSVMTYVSRLRSVLGEDAIERAHDGY